MTNLRRMLVALPTAVTLTSVLFGFLSILWATAQPVWAGVALVFAALCDGLDGRVARATRTQSEFGVQLDSLADMVSFGMAPAYLIYTWALSGLSWGSFDLGLAIAFVYVSCGAIRLARFNVMAQNPESQSSFTGVPIPLAALTLVGLVLTSHELGAEGMQRAALVGPVTLGISILMISGIRFPSFKKNKSRKANIALAAAVLVTGGLMLTTMLVGVLLLVVSGLYIASGVVPFVGRCLRLLKPRRRSKTAG